MGIFQDQTVRKRRLSLIIQLSTLTDEDSDIYLSH